MMLNTTVLDTSRDIVCAKNREECSILLSKSLASSLIDIGVATSWEIFGVRHLIKLWKVSWLTSLQ